jgi:hypothetical protein
MPVTVIKTFADVQKTLTAFATSGIAESPHLAFWNTSYENFVTGNVPNVTDPNNNNNPIPILIKGDGKSSAIILALSGLPPFDGSDPPLAQMPAPAGPYLDQDTIDAISAWIDAGANE